MKRMLWILLTLTVLTGCTAAAGPTAATAGTAAQPTVVPTQTEPTESLPPVDAWASDPVLAALPKAREGLVWEKFGGTDPHYRHCVTNDQLTGEEAVAYLQTLQQAGFTVDGQYLERRESDSQLRGFTYYAQDAQGNFLQLMGSSLGGDQWKLFLWLAPLASEEVPPQAQPQTQSWDAEPLLALLPLPPTDYWTVVPGGEWGYGECTGAHLAYMPYSQVLEYSQCLLDAGFCHFTQYDKKVGMYRFSGVNDQGYMVELSYSAHQENRVYVSVYAPASPENNPWEMYDYKNRHILEPPAEDWSMEQIYEMTRCTLLGMTYQDASEYLEAVQRHAKDMGYQSRISGLEQRPEEEYLRFRVSILSSGSPIPEHKVEWELIYDGSNTDCPCVLVQSPLI